MLHNKFLVVPIDKASGNVAFICQRHYAQVLVNELGLNNVNNITSMHAAVTEALDKTISEKASFLKNKFNLDVMDIKNVYWPPKLYRNSTKARFVLAAPKCSVKPLSIVVKSALKLI